MPICVSIHAFACDVSAICVTNILRLSSNFSHCYISGQKMNESLSGSRLRVLKIMISAGRRLAFWFTMQLIFLAFVHFLFGIS